MEIIRQETKLLFKIVYFKTSSPSLHDCLMKNNHDMVKMLHYLYKSLPLEVMQVAKYMCPVSSRTEINPGVVYDQ